MELRAATYNVSLAQSEGFFEEAAQKSSCFGLGTLPKRKFTAPFLLEDIYAI